MTLFLDFETRCRLDLKKVGAYRYTRHSSFQVLLMATAVDDGPVVVEEARADLAHRLAALFTGHAEVVAHNTSFERLVCRALHVEADDAVWNCTASRARMAGLPGSLAGACAALRLPMQKDPTGTRLIRWFCTPRADGTFNACEGEVWEHFKRYCGTDVEASRQLHRALPPLPPYERRVFLYDMRLNDRGVRIDMPLLHAAQAVAKTAGEAIDAEVEAMTGGWATRATQRDRIMNYVADHVVDAPDMRRRTIEALLLDEAVPANVRQVLALRQEGARSSPRKLEAMARRADNDTLRGMLLYHAAGTGRHSSIGVQLQNLPRPGRPWSDILHSLLDLATGNAERVRVLHGPPLSVIADALRSFIVPERDHVFEVCDLNAVELRGCAWLCGEQWVLDALEAGEDVYCRTASSIYGRTIGKGDERERFLGKTIELAGQYGMGEKRLVATCAAQDVVIEAGFAKRAIITYRSTHPAIRAGWYALENAAKAAVRNAGATFRACRVEFRMERGWLLCRLPSGRCLFYREPRVLHEQVAREDGTTWEREVLTFMGVDRLTRQWRRLRIWGALLLENITQGLCRDLLMEGCFKLESLGHPVRLIVHDETVSEVRRGEADIGLVERVLGGPVAWAPGLVLAAKGMVTERYRKI